MGDDDGALYRDNDAAAISYNIRTYAQAQITKKRVLCIPWTAPSLAGHIILTESKGTEFFSFAMTNRGS